MAEKNVKVAVFSAKPYDQAFFDAVNQQLPLSEQHELVYFSSHLNAETVFLAKNFPCVCPFVNDSLTAPVIQALN